MQVIERVMQTYGLLVNLTPREEEATPAESHSIPQRQKRRRPHSGYWKPLSFFAAPSHRGPGVRSPWQKRFRVRVLLGDKLLGTQEWESR
jgi:hypothetical protein